MSDNGGNSQDRLGRLLREQGPAQAPPGMAGDVMRRVRAEPRPAAPSRWRPAALLAAAALLAIAAILGISRLGNGSSNSANGGGHAGQAVSERSIVKTPGGGAGGGTSEDALRGVKSFRHVPETQLYRAFTLAAGLPACGSLDTYVLHVRESRLDAARMQLTRFAPVANGVTIRLKADPDPHARPHLTCP